MTTSYSPTWGTAYAQVTTKSTLSKRLAQLLNKRSLRADRELLLTLNGVVAGSAASETYKRVAHSTTNLGGVRTIETKTLLSRNSAAGDVTDINARLLAYRSTPTTYPTDKATLF